MVQVFARLENELAMCNHMLHLMHSDFIFFIPCLCAMCVQLQMIPRHNFKEGKTYWLILYGDGNTQYAFGIFFKLLFFFIFVFVSTKRHEHVLHIICTSFLSTNVHWTVWCTWFFHNYNIIAFDCRRCCSQTHSLVTCFFLLIFLFFWK